MEKDKIETVRIISELKKELINLDIFKQHTHINKEELETIIYQTCLKKIKEVLNDE